MTAPKTPRFDTLTLHAGQQPDPTTGARAVPIYQTTSYVFDDTEHAAALFNLERAGHIYSRISNPTVAVLEERISALEGGVGAVATASGQAALHLAIATLMGAGGHIVASARIYGGSHNMFTHTLPRFGITTTLADPRDPASFDRAINGQDAPRVCRDARQPGPGSARHQGRGRRRAQAQAAADARLHLHHALPVPPLRARRRHRHAFRHQVPRRPRHRHRRHRRRRRPVRLGRLGQVPDHDRALCRLSRHLVCRGVRPRRLHHARPRRGPARLRRLHEPGQRLLPAAGHRDAARAHGPPCRQRRGRRPLPGEARRGRLGEISGPRKPSRPRARQAAMPQGRGRHHELRHQGRAQGRRQADRAACARSRTSPTSATPNRW